MRLTRFTEYSLRVLVYLGQNADRRVTINQISETYDISKNHLMKVVSNLTRSQFVAARRGPGGGIQLNHPPAEICLGDVINATEKNLRELQNSKPSDTRPTEADTRLGIFMRQALLAYIETLGRFTLADVLESGSDADKLLDMKGKAA